MGALNLLLKNERNTPAGMYAGLRFRRFRPCGPALNRFLRQINVRGQRVLHHCRTPQTLLPLPGFAVHGGAKVRTAATGPCRHTQGLFLAWRVRAGTVSETGFSFGRKR